MSIHENHSFHIVNKRPWPLTGAIGAIVTLIGLIKWFHHNDDTLLGIGAIIINFNPMMMRCNPGRNIPRVTHKNSNKRTTMRDNPIYCIRNPILRIILLSILPYKIITNNWTRINLTTNRNPTIQPNTSTFTKYSNLISFRSNCNMSSSWPTRK